MQTLAAVYILLHFPYLTETFVAQEIQFIQSRGIDVRIISLLKPGPGPVQPLSQQLLRDTWYAPELLDANLWRAQVHFIRRAPRLYWGLLAKLLRQPFPWRHPELVIKRLVIFLKEVAVAYHLEGDDQVRLLHSHFAWLSGAAAWVCARLLNLPFTVTVHAYDLYSYKSDLLRLVGSQATHVVAISEQNRQQLITSGVCPARAISVIHCGVDLSLAKHGREVDAQRPANGPVKVLSVGSLVAKKGHACLIAACELLNQRGLDFRCTIIGSGPDEPALRRQIQQSGLQERVKILPACPHPEVMDAYQQHDLFVLASVVAADGDRDGIPVVLMEAGAFGLPLISTEVSGIPELVRHGQTGWLVPPRHVAALADAISALALDPALRARLGRNARALVEDEFSSTRNAARMASLFRQIRLQLKPNSDTVLQWTTIESELDLVEES